MPDAYDLPVLLARSIVGSQERVRIELETIPGPLPIEVAPLHQLEDIDSVRGAAS